MAPRKKSQAGQGSEPAIQLKGVHRALHVLEYIAIHPGRAIDIAEGLGLSWATMHRTLQQLEQGGFLKRDLDTNRYSIGPRMWFIGATYVANHRVLEAAKTYLEEARRLPGVTVQLVERSRYEAVALYSTHSDEEITKATYGYHFPLHVGSKGQVLLAYAEPNFVDSYLSGDLEQLTPYSLTDPKEIRELLAKIRSQGYAVTLADVQLFTGSMAAPVFDRGNKIVACVCFVAKKSAIENPKRREEILETMLKTAQSISIALGWRPGQGKFI